MTQNILLLVKFRFLMFFEGFLGLKVFASQEKIRRIRDVKCTMHTRNEYHRIGPRQEDQDRQAGGKVPPDAFLSQPKFGQDLEVCYCLFLLKDKKKKKKITFSAVLYPKIAFDGFVQFVSSNFS